MAIFSKAKRTEHGSAFRQTNFDKSEDYVAIVIAFVFVLTGLVSGYATFSGIRLFLEEVGQSNFLVNGTAVIITIATAAIVTVGWSLITKYGPEARTLFLKFCMIDLGLFLLLITLCVSSLSNLMALVGPAAKIHDWRETQRTQTAIVEQLELSSLNVTKLLPGWRAEAAKACPAADQELNGGAVSGTGRGAGPVAFALSGVCEQTKAFVVEMESSIAKTDIAVREARDALTAMRFATRNRKLPVIEREDDFLNAGDALSSAMQKLRAADLTEILSAGALQVKASIAELANDSVFTRQQVETILSIRQGIEGLVASTEAITAKLQANPLPERQIISSPDYIEGVIKHAWRFVPVFAAAIGIDLFALWALFFMLTLKAGRKKAFDSKTAHA